MHTLTDPSRHVGGLIEAAAAIKHADSVLNIGTVHAISLMIATCQAGDDVVLAGD